MDDCLDEHKTVQINVAGQILTLETAKIAALVEWLERGIARLLRRKHGR